MWGAFQSQDLLVEGCRQGRDPGGVLCLDPAEEAGKRSRLGWGWWVWASSVPEADRTSSGHVSRQLSSSRDWSSQSRGPERRT